MQSYPPVLLAAVAFGVLAAATALSSAVVASLRGGESRATARRLAPLTVAPAIVAFLLGALALGGTVPTVAPLGGVLVTSAALVPAVRSLWWTGESEARMTAHPAD